MKKIIVASFAAVIMGFGGITLAAPSNAATQSSPITGQIMVKFRDSRAAAGVLRQHGLSEGPGIGSTGAQLIKVPAGKESQLIEALSRNPAVEYAEPDELVTAATDDEYFPRQYALQNNGQSFTNTAGNLSVAGGVADADVDAVEAWNVTTGGGTKVAIIDSGVASDNPDIAPKVVARANFSDAATGEDNYGHGTHIAGIVAATANNTIGVAGVCPNCTENGRSQGYDVGSGTSMASPIVAAAAALAWSSHTGSTNTSVRANVESTADKIPGTGTYWAYGRVNAYNAVR
jgi:thermitase